MKTHFKGLRVPIIVPIKGRGFINQGCGLATMFQKSLSFCGLQPNSCGGACALALIYHQSLSPRLQLLSSYAFLLPDGPAFGKETKWFLQTRFGEKEIELLHPQEL